MAGEGEGASSGDDHAPGKAAVTLAEFSASGELSSEMAREVIEFRLPEIQACADRAGEVCGRLSMEVETHRHDLDTSLRYPADTAKSSAFTSCVSDVFGTMKYPSKGHSARPVTYSFTLQVGDCP